eukprot:6966079-Pyramimonas_sp.AAC.1
MALLCCEPRKLLPASTEAPTPVKQKFQNKKKNAPATILDTGRGDRGAVEDPRWPRLVDLRRQGQLVEPRHPDTA